MFRLRRLTPDEIRARKEIPVEVRRYENQEDLKAATRAGLAFAAFLGFVVACIHGGTVTASLAGFGASMGLGGVLGFLFGVPASPRGGAPVTIQKAGDVAIGSGEHANAKVDAAPVAKPSADPNEPPAGDATQEHSSAVPSQNPDLQPKISSNTSAVTQPVPESSVSANSTSIGNGSSSSKPGAGPSLPEHQSNLEQVADWVTKLLLGGGLTQMQRIPPKIWQWSRVVALGILQGQPNASTQEIVAQQAFAAGLLVYGFVVGFFGGFLITKLELGKAISDA